MQKIRFILVLAVFLCSQVMLSGASVLCVTPDGQAHIERADGHGRCVGKPHDGCGEHAHDGATTEALRLAAPDCQCLPLSHTCMLMMSVKRFSKTAVCGCLHDTGIQFDSTDHTIEPLCPRPARHDRLISLRSVILLI